MRALGLVLFLSTYATEALTYAHSRFRFIVSLFSICSRLASAASRTCRRSSAYRPSHILDTSRSDPLSLALVPRACHTEGESTYIPFARHGLSTDVPGSQSSLFAHRYIIHSVLHSYHERAVLRSSLFAHRSRCTLCQFVDRKAFILKLEKALYGLKQGRQEWYKTLCAGSGNWVLQGLRWTGVFSTSTTVSTCSCSRSMLTTASSQGAHDISLTRTRRRTIPNSLFMKIHMCSLYGASVEVALYIIPVIQTVIIVLYKTCKKVEGNIYQCSIYQSESMSSSM